MKRFVVMSLFLWALSPGSAISGGIPVMDSTNLTQNIMGVLQNVMQTMKQVKEYQTQMDQYQTQLQNTLSPSTFVWDDAQGTIMDILGTIDTLSTYKQQVGDLDSYLNKFRDMNYYENLLNDGYSQDEIDQLYGIDALGSETKREANNALIRTVDNQQASLQADADQLQDIQSQAEGSQGQMEAMQSTNMLLSNISNQLLQMRGLLIAQNNALAEMRKDRIDKEARQRAASKQLRSGTFEKTPDDGQRLFHEFN